MSLVTTKQDKRHLSEKMKLSFKDTVFRKYIRDNITVKSAKTPKNKSKNIGVNIIHTNMNDSLRLNVDETIDNFLKPVIVRVKDFINENEISESFKLTQKFLNKNNIKVDLCEFTEVKINDFIFYYSITDCKKDLYEYDFNDENTDFEKGHLDDEDLQKIVENTKRKRIDVPFVYDVRFIFPTKKGK